MTYRMRKHPVILRRGFTLVELMAVVVILGLLVATVAVAVRSRVGESKTKLARTRASIIAQAVEEFALDNNRIPTQEEGLQILVNPPAGSSHKYLKPTLLKDPWGQPYIYSVPGRYSDYEIISLGADGQPGGEGENADISTDDEYEAI